jgi:hypothetical protein
MEGTDSDDVPTGSSFEATATNCELHQWIQNGAGLVKMTKVYIVLESFVARAQPPHELHETLLFLVCSILFKNRNVFSRTCARSIAALVLPLFVSVSNGVECNRTDNDGVWDPTLGG